MIKCIASENVPFKLYTISAGMIWYIAGEKASIVVQLNDGDYITIDIDENMRRIDKDGCTRIKKIKIFHKDDIYIVENFKVSKMIVDTYIANLNTIKSNSGAILCGCFDGMTINHQRLLKVASCFSNVVVFVDQGDITTTKHHSTSKFMYDTTTRINCVKSFLIDRKCSSIVVPRTESMAKSIEKGYNILKTKGNVMYVCGYDQSLYVDSKIKNIPVKTFFVDRINYKPEQNRPTVPLILKHLDLIDICDYPEESALWFSSTLCRNRREITRSLDALGIDYVKSGYTKNPLFYKMNSIDRYLCAPLQKYSRIYIKDTIGTPVLVNANYISQISSSMSRQCVILPGRSARVSDDSFILEWGKISEVIDRTGNVVKLFAYDYSDRDTVSCHWLGKLYNQGWYNNDAIAVFLAFIAPRVSKTMCYVGMRWCGQKLSYEDAFNNMKTLTFITRSYGSVVSHMVSLCAIHAMVSIGYTLEEIDKLLKEIISIDFGNIVSPEKNITYFTHKKFIGSMDKTALIKLADFNKTLDGIIVIDSLRSAYKETDNGRITYDDIKTHYKYHKSISYLGDSDNPLDKETKMIVSSAIFDSIMRTNRTL